ncbi:MAG: hypothetical protein MRZ49_05500 [Lachnospiraceae bacterium]|nr:hypothetical protein [Lachnospiraceae bacterium]
MANKKINYAFFTVLLVLYSALMMSFFYRQVMPRDGIFYSDMEAYILETQGLESGYEFPYRLFFWVSRVWTIFLSPAVAVAFTTMLCNSAAVILTKYYFDKNLQKYARQEGIVWNTAWELVSTLAVFSLFFVSMVYSPRGTAFFGFDYIYRCMGILTPNPYWNATYLAVRPLTIATFFLGIDLLAEYETVLSWKKVTAFGVLVFLCTFTKPSFTFILVPTGAIILLYRLLKNKGKTWKNTLLFCLSLLPTGVLLLYQFSNVFTGTNSHAEETGIGFELFKAWHVYSNNIPLSLVMALAFPIAVLVLNMRQMKNDGGVRLAWQLWLTGFLTFLICYEKGFRFSHMNFSWGYMHGLFFVFMVSILQMIRNLMRKGTLSKRLMSVPEIVLFAYHLICGIVFFVYMYQGNNVAWF